MYALTGRGAALLDAVLDPAARCGREPGRTAAASEHPAAGRAEARARWWRAALRIDGMDCAACARTVEETGREPADLRPLGAAACEPIPVRPQRLPIRAVVSSFAEDVPTGTGQPTDRSAPEAGVRIAGDLVEQRTDARLRGDGCVSVEPQVAAHRVDRPRLVARLYRNRAMPLRVDSGPYSGLHGGRHSQIVIELPSLRGN